MGIMKAVVSFWGWLKLNDLPNWVAIVLWPIVLFLWNQREVNNIPNLQVSLSKTTMTLGGQGKDALSLNFLNNTGSVVYLTNVCILKCSKLFQVDAAASRDIAQSSHELKFSGAGTVGFTERQIILQTNETKESRLSLKSVAPEGMLIYQPHWFRKIIHHPKYFLLKYIALVGGKRYRVSTIY